MPSLAKPTTAGVAIITGTAIGLETSDTFRIKVRRFRPVYNNVIVDTTGDGDILPFFEHSGYLYMSFAFQGWMLSANAVGIVNLVSTNNPTAEVVFNLTALRALKFNAILETIAIDWDRVAPFVGIALTGRMHNTVVSNVEV